MKTVEELSSQTWPTSQGFSKKDLSTGVTKLLNILVYACDSHF